MKKLFINTVDFFLNILKKNKRLATLIDDDFRDQFIRYLVIGFATFGIEWTGFALLTSVLKIQYLLASCVVFFIVFWFNFLLNRKWSFKSTQNLKRQIFLYLLLFAFNLIVANIGLMYLLTDVVGIHELLSKVIMMFAVVLWNFVLYKKVIYK